MSGSIIIDCFPESAFRYKNGYAIVVIDVIRATTTAITALSLGRRVFPGRTTDNAYQIASILENPLLVGELGGNMPFGFDLTNSPAQIAKREDIDRPMILISSSGTSLLMNSAGSEAVHIACFRNYSAVAEYLSDKQKNVAIIGAGTRGQFRREDQMCCAWIAEKLLRIGYVAENLQTKEYVNRWSGASSEEAGKGNSAEYLRQSGQEEDLKFILNHIDDLEIVPSLIKNELKVINK